MDACTVQIFNSFASRWSATLTQIFETLPSQKFQIFFQNYSHRLSLCLIHIQNFLILKVHNVSHVLLIKCISVASNALTMVLENYKSPYFTSMHSIVACLRFGIQ